MNAAAGPSRPMILDIDGTLLDTPHFAAWQDALYDLCAQWAPMFTSDLYQRHVAGKPRLTGAIEALASIGVDLLRQPSLASMLAERKQERFKALMDRTTLFADADRLLERIAAARAPVGFCTASANAGTLLHRCIATRPYGSWIRSRLVRSLDAVHSAPTGRGAALLVVAAEMRTTPRAVLVVDDADHGVSAALAMGMSAVLVSRWELDGARPPAGAGVVRSLDAIRVEAAEFGQPTDTRAEGSVSSSGT